MLAWTASVTAAVAMALAACGQQRSPEGGGEAAVAACRALLGQVAEQERLATTVHEESPGFLIRAWTSGRAEGPPDYLCGVARDEDGDGGVRVVTLTSRDSAGGYQSSLDIEFDE